MVTLERPRPSPPTPRSHPAHGAARPFDPSRRRFLVAGALGLLATACGDDDGATSDTTVDTGFPRTVTHGLGQTAIPAKPARIVATADRDQLDVLLAMGLRPVQYGASGDYDGTPPWIDATLVTGIESARMSDAFVPNLELIASARPDLIIDAWADETTQAALAAIAPTVQIKTAITDSWQNAQLLAGQACGEEAAAARAVAETRDVIGTQARRLEPHAPLTVAVAFFLGQQLSMITGSDIGGRIVTELGLSVLSTPDGASGNFSLEQIPTLLDGADIVLSFDYGNRADQEANPLFRNLPAVASGGYVSVSTEVATACYQESTLSLRWAADKVADALLVAAEGRGIRLTS